MDILETVRLVIVYHIKKAGYSSFELFAHENGISKSTLSLILNGKREPRIRTLETIAKALEIEISTLFAIPNPQDDDFKKLLKLKNQTGKFGELLGNAEKKS